MTTPDTLELLRKAAERAKPYWGAVDMMLGGNPIAADIVTPFAQSISPDVYIALLDRLDALEGRGAWQSIETAPRDGTWVLLFSVPNEVPSLRPHIADGYWKETSGFMAPGLWMLGHAVGPSFTPTHWRPLPEPPTTLADEGRDQ